MLASYAALNPSKLLKKERNMKREPIIMEVPQVIVDQQNGRRYFKGRLLGKGGFARCYEVTDMMSNKMYACKVVAKSRLTKPNQREKVMMEINLHRSLSHRYIVGFHGNFEDDQNIYILLELCSRKSLVQLMKQRKSLTEPEVRYFMHQSIQACAFLHSESVIHRDIKLGNFFLNQDMEIRLGDLGLAVKVDSENDKQTTICGTPNYIAPEVLGKGGHSYEVDVWALGCVMYTLLVGRPPFETRSLKDTYSRIKNNDYTIPTRISKTSCRLVQRLLSDKPEDRPNLATVLQDEFFTRGYMPSVLPTVCCVAPPRFTSRNKESSTEESFASSREQTSDCIRVSGDKEYSRKLINVSESIKSIKSALSHMKIKDNDDKNCSDVSPNSTTTMTSVVETREIADGASQNSVCQEYFMDMRKPYNYVPPERLYVKLNTCLTCMPSSPETPPKTPDASSRGSTDSLTVCDEEKKTREQVHSDSLWITKWVDYSNKYGFGAQLSDSSVLVRFNDCTKMALSPDKSIVQFTEKDKRRLVFPTVNPPEDLSRKVALLTYFSNYMEKHLLKGGNGREEKAQQEDIELPQMEAWFRTQRAMVMYLSTGVLQVNFLSDHTKVVLNPGTTDDLITYVNKERKNTSYLMSDIVSHGCNRELASRLEYCKVTLKKLMTMLTDEL